MYLHIIVCVIIIYRSVSDLVRVNNYCTEVNSYISSIMLLSRLSAL